jgi:hypothetical protein
LGAKQNEPTTKSHVALVWVFAQKNETLPTTKQSELEDAN